MHSQGMIEALSGDLLKRYSSVELQTFLSARPQRAEEYVSLHVDPSNREVVNKLEIDKTINSSPLVILNYRNPGLGFLSEAIFKHPDTDGLFLQISTTGGAKNTEVLLKMFRDHWKDAPSKTGINVEAMWLSPQLTSQFQTFLEEVDS